MNFSKLYELMEKQELDAILLTNRENDNAGRNLRYSTGFSGTAGYAFISKDIKLFLTDFRYTEIAKSQVKGFEIVELTSSFKDFSNELFKKHNIKRLGFDKQINYAEYESYEKDLDVELVPMNNIIENLRLVKSEEELEIMRRAANIADQAFTHILDFIKPGITEVEIAHELERQMKILGAEGNSFDPIIASGERGCLPHGRATDKVIKSGELITMDFGCYVDGYASDITRTIAVGDIDPKLEEIYNIVLEAQIKGVEAVKAGIKGSDVDKVCRDIIDSKGYKENFGHGTGHGLGLNVHEGPSCGKTSQDILMPGHVVTVEPGIYINGLGGVRIEDDVVVKEDGFEVLTKSPKQLIKL